MNKQTDDKQKIFHSMEQLKVELFPNISLDEAALDDDSTGDDQAEANSLAEKLVHDLITGVEGSLK